MPFKTGLSHALRPVQLHLMCKCMMCDLSWQCAACQQHKHFTSTLLGYSSLLCAQPPWQPLQLELFFIAVVVAQCRFMYCVSSRGSRQLKTP